MYCTSSECIFLKVFFVFLFYIMLQCILFEIVLLYVKVISCWLLVHVIAFNNHNNNCYQ